MIKKNGNQEQGELSHFDGFKVLKIRGVENISGWLTANNQPVLPQALFHPQVLVFACSDIAHLHSGGIISKPDRSPKKDIYEPGNKTYTIVLMNVLLPLKCPCT